MKNWQVLALSPGSTVREAMVNISKNSVGIVLVVNDSQELMGVITDGDIRRGLLNSVPMEATVDTIMKKNPFTMPEGSKKKDIIKKMQELTLQHVPIINEQKKIIDLKVLKDMIKSEPHENIVFINAGGMGKRLMPLTENCPKPLLPVGNKPIMENILKNFAEAGFKNFYLSVNYKAQMVIDYFGDGKKWDVNIQYVIEQNPLGTAGAIAHLKNKTKLPVIVSNGDLLTNVDYEGLLSYHNQSGSQATMCIREFDLQIPYGVVNVENHKMLRIVEKPVHKFFINAGIYVLSSESIALIPDNQFFDMPTLLEKVKEKKGEVSTFPIHEYWLDIGRLDDFEKAQIEISSLVKE